MSWNCVSLSEVLYFIRGITFKPEDKVELFEEGSAICMRTKNIQENLELDDLIAIPHTFVKRTEQYLKKGDLLISSANSWELVGKLVQVPELKYTATAGGFISILRPREGLIDSEYLYRFLSMPATQHRIRYLGRKTTNISNLDRKRFLEIKIPLPSLEVQKNIASVLKKSGTLRQQCQQMDTELSALAQSIFLEMFRDTEKKAPLGEHTSFITSGSRGWAKYYSDSGARFIRSLDVQMNHIGDKDIAFVNAPEGKESERTRVQAGDVLLTITGSRIGRVCWVPDDLGEAYISQHVAIIRLKPSLTPEYVSFFLSMKNLGQRMIENAQYGQTKPGLNLEQIRSFEIPIVPVVQQKNFLSVIRKIQIQREQSAQKLESLTSLFNALMQRAFKGELKL